MFPPLGSIPNFTNLNALQNFGRPMPLWGSNPPQHVLPGGNMWGGQPPVAGPIGPYPVSPIAPAPPGFGSNPPQRILPGQPGQPGFGSNPPGPIDPGQLQQLMALRQMMQQSQRQAY